MPTPLLRGHVPGMGESMPSERRGRACQSPRRPCHKISAHPGAVALPEVRQCPPWRAWPGQKKKAVQKVQAPAQPFVALDPARPTEDQSARRARHLFNCLPQSIRPVWWASTLDRNFVGVSPILVAQYRPQVQERLVWVAGQMELRIRVAPNPSFHPLPGRDPCARRVSWQRSGVLSAARRLTPVTTVSSGAPSVRFGYVSLMEEPDVNSVRSVKRTR